MRLVLSFAAFGGWEEGLRAPILPMDVAVEPYGRYRIEDKHAAGEPDDRAERNGGGDKSLSLAAEREVERPEDIGLVEDFFFDLEAFERRGAEELGKALSSPEVDQLSEGARLVGAALSFAIAVPLRVHPQPFEPNRFIAEDERDRRLLDELGMERVRISHTFSHGVEVFDDCEVDAHLITELARRGTVGVYAEAMRLDGYAARFRELWRTLEVAFQAHGARLISLIAEFPPAQELGFEKKELEALLALRGQISHASSRPGPRDVARFEREATRRLGRLWTLVDRVILTKRDSSQDLEVDELQPLVAHIGPDGWPCVRPEIDAEEWLRLFGSRSERFQ